MENTGHDFHLLHLAKYMLKESVNFSQETVLKCVLGFLCVLNTENNLMSMLSNSQENDRSERNSFYGWFREVKFQIEMMNVVH